MSRVGSKEIIIPDNVKVSVEGENVYAEGPMGKLRSKVNKGILIITEGNKITMNPENSDKSTVYLFSLFTFILFFIPFYFLRTETAIKEFEGEKLIDTDEELETEQESN